MLLSLFNRTKQRSDADKALLGLGFLKVSALAL